MDNKKRLTIGFLIGMIAISVTSLSFSIAWYASSNFLRVDPIDIAIECDRSIKISPTTNPEDFKEDWFTKAGYDNITDVVNGWSEPVELTGFPLGETGAFSVQNSLSLGILKGKNTEEHTDLLHLV